MYEIDFFNFSQVAKVFAINTKENTQENRDYVEELLTKTNV